MKHLLPKFLLLICCGLLSAGLQSQDLDGDGVMNSIDNCVSIYNPNQADTNQDGIGDACVSCQFTNPITDLPFLANIVQESDCCFAGFITQYTYQGVAYFATGQHSPLDPFICPADVPVTIYNCAGDFMCYSGGLLDPNSSTICSAVLPNDFFTASTSLALWNCSDLGTDSDYDGVTDENDNCVNMYNPSQADANNDGLGDACASCTFTDPLLELSFLANIVQEYECCTQGYIRQYDYNGFTYFGVGQRVIDDPDLFCPTDVPSIIYNCQGIELCFNGGLLPPNEPGHCATALPIDFYNAASTVELWSCDDPQPCYDPSIIIDGACITLYDPVCGCDGNTYSNSCVASALNGITSWTPGECSSSTYNVCLGTGVEIGTSGFVPNVIYQWSPTDGLSCSNCPNPIASPLTTTTYTLSEITTVDFGSDPFLTTHTVVVDNSCPVPAETFSFTMCEGSGTFTHDFSVGDEEGYSVLLQPANGNASITFIPFSTNRLFYTPNDGFVGTDQIYLNHSDFNGTGLSSELVLVNITVQDCGCICPTVVAPVCGVNGVTYENSCFAECDGVAVNYDGPCIDCTLPPDVGPCDGLFPRWYFDSDLGACLQFDWGGCGGNANNFETYELCVSSCNPDCLFCPAVYDPVCGSNGVTYSNSCEAECSGVSDYFPGVCTDCNIPPAEGDCLAVIPRWYFNPITESCTQFSWDGCFDSPNNFETLELCVASCDPPECDCANIYDPVCGSDGITYGNACLANCAGITLFNPGECNECTLLPETGPCAAAFLRWYYNPLTDNCAQFLWGGCGGNANNYTSYELCMDSCGPGCICTSEYNPVCGSDGITYGNACEASCAGVSWTVGECSDGCYDPSVLYPNIDCNAYPNDPVCGCNGVTYANSCEAYYLNGIVSYTAGSCNGNNNCSLNQQWIQSIIGNACGNACLSAVQLIEYQGTQYIATVEGNQYCSDGITTIYNCNGTVHCLTGGIAGFNQCPDLVQNYSIVQNLWNENDCGNCICTEEYDPVCGADGVTYSNACYATCAGVSWTPGECNDGCYNASHHDPNANCSNYEYAPVCGCDGVTYANNCEAYFVAGLDVYYAGPCNNDCVCPDVYDPVCGSDGVSYGNSCEAECAGVSWTAGECGDGIPDCYDAGVLYNIDCSSYGFDPVCGCDNVTYDNICEAFYLNGITSYTVGSCSNGKSTENTHNTSDLPVVICDEQGSPFSLKERIGSSTNYANGTLRFFGNCVQYIPKPAFSGTDYIQLKWIDENGLSEVQHHEIQVGTTSGIDDEIVKVSSLEVRYDQQNPNTVWFYDANYTPANSEYKIFNIEGKLLMKGNADSGQWAVDVSNERRGVYVIQTINGTSKFVVR